MKSVFVELREVTKDNWLECVGLETKTDQQRFVSSNLFSLAQSKFEPSRVPCAIYNQRNDLVGFTLYNDTPLKDGSYRLSRLMIDKNYQGRGYGRAAAQAVIERLSNVAGCHEIILDYVPENDIAAKLWKELGFVVFSRYGENLVAKLVL